MRFPQNGRDTYFSGRSAAVSYTVLIPGMKFTCNANITRVRVGGVMRSGNQRMKLRIWKQHSLTPRIYRKSEDIIDLAPDNACILCNYNNRRYTCLLMGENQISVEPGDILGIELPPREDADFVLHSFPAPGLMNYIFEGTNLSSTVWLRNRSRVIKMPRPLVMLRISTGQGDSGTLDLWLGCGLIMTWHVLID